MIFNHSSKFDFTQASINNISRLEVYYTPTPESPGSALAGGVNLVPRSAFDRAKPVFNYSAFLMMRDDARDFRKTPGPLREPTRKVHPGFDFSYVAPVSKTFGFTLTGAHSQADAADDFGLAKALAQVYELERKVRRGLAHRRSRRFVSSSMRS